MKMIAFFLLVTFMQVSAGSFAQRITISRNNIPIKKLFKEIERQTGYQFFYKEKLFRQASKTNVYVVNGTLEQVLDQCFRELRLAYSIVDKVVVITEKDLPVKKQEVLEIVAPAAMLVSGKVVDDQNRPLRGVTVTNIRTGIATQTDEAGNFRIEAHIGDPIEFSSIGYEKVQYKTDANTTGIVIRLKMAVTNLDETVVVGYGTQKKLTVTGAVSSVSTEQLKQSSSASLANALAGRLTGLTSLQSGGGQPGRDDAVMYLRGAATTNSTDMLILIDGVPRDNIRTLDPNEVATVTVLKDASATAVFGVRGANGVMLITTRRGSEGKIAFNASIDQSYTSFTREPERLHSVDYMKLRNEAAENDGNPAPFSQADIDRYTNPLAGLDPNDPNYAGQVKLRQYMYPDHDYYREYVARYSPQTRVNLSATGGTSKINYFVNGLYLHQGGNLKTEPQLVLGYDPSSWMDRYSFRANLDYKITASLKSFLNIGSYIERVNMPQSGQVYGYNTNWMMNDIINMTQSILPITPGPTTIAGFGVAPGQIVDPTLNGDRYMDRSAFEIINRMGYRSELRSNLNSTLGAEWDLSNAVTKGLSMKGMISYDAKATTGSEGQKLERLYRSLVNTTTNGLSYAEARSSESLLSLGKAADSRYNINLQGSVNYNRSFEKHAVTGMVLVQRDNWEVPQGSSEQLIPYNVVGFASRFTYGFDNRYLTEVNMGYNGSEQFAPKKRFGFFPAASLGWVVSNEKFFKPLRDVITNLKFRASYGKVGNDQIGGRRFLYTDNITMGGGPLPSLGLGRGVNLGLLGNSSITWETAVKKNLGVDIGLFGDLTASFDYFTEHRSDILISRQSVPILQGVPLGNIPKVNMGIVDNKGYELELTYNKTFSKDFSLLVKGNYSYNHNTVRFIDEPIRDSSYAYQFQQTGYSLGQLWGYKIDYGNGNGYFNSKEELDAYLAKTTYGFGSPRVGDFKYLDLNGDGEVNDKDLAPIGYPAIPRVNFGFMFSVRYKGMELTPFFQGVTQYYAPFQYQGAYEYNFRGTYFGYQRTAWTAERYANGEKITYPALSTHQNTNHVANDFFVMDRSFIRLKNIELAYTLPAGALKRFAVQGFRVYVSAYNYFTWDRLRMNHLDPEGTSALGYPITKSLNFGANITF
ncbi:TonB-dependent receptor [Niabella drilacis]|nr:TonB-dependent receptor [Niabella drilacis]